MSSPRRVLSLLVVLAAASACQRAPREYREWRVYGGDPGGTRYSALDQINRSNVRRLQVAWIHHTGDRRIDPPSTIECNPIVVDGVMYVTSPSLKAMALDAATGKRLWVFDPFQGGPARGVSRGVMYWEDAGREKTGALQENGEDKRIFFSAGFYLYALDARTGHLKESFGDRGKVDLREGLDRDVSGLSVTASTPGVIYGDLLILGSSVGEGPQPAAPGHIRAYDVRSGRRSWIFHTIPHPGEFGYESWEKDSWLKAGGANSWGGMTLDPERGVVFLGTGSATFDFYGGDRKGQNLFANCILALRADTGERVWHYQTVHHDIWDLDIPCPPNLVTVTHQGRRIDALAQVTKMGLIFLLDRHTGEPLFPVEERPVPASDLEGEQAWPTQPFPLKPPPLCRLSFTEEEVTDISPEAHAQVLERFRQLRSGSIYTPASRQGTIVFPGYHGGANWQGAAFDPTTGVLYANVSEIPWVATLKSVEESKARFRPSRGEQLYQTYCASCHGLPVQRQRVAESSLEPIRAGVGKEEVFQLLEKGKGRMQAFPGLKPEEKHALFAFLSGGAAHEPAAAEDRYPYPYVFTGYHRFVDQEGYPAVKPPWGTLNAVNLNTGEMVWRVPLGEVPELAARGIRKTGTETFGGCVVTAGGLLFVGASKDQKFRAFDKKTGEILWETTLEANAMATPATYEIAGKQYVVVAAGGGAGNRVRDRLDARSGDAFVAFALP